MVYGVMAVSFGGRSRWVAAVLCGALGSLVGLCGSSWRSSRSTSLGLSSCSRSGRSDDFLYYLHGAAAHYGGSDPSGAGLSGRPQVPAFGCGGFYRHLERPRSMGSKSSGWAHYINKTERDIFGECGREKGQVQQCVGPGRRHGVRAGRDIEQGGVLHPVCAGDGWHAGGLGRPHVGAAGGDDPEGEGDATATLRGFRHLAAIRQETPEVAEVQVLRDDAGRHVQLKDGGWPFLLPTLVAELQGSNLMQWENKIETLNNRYGDCWHLIAEADDRGRGEQMAKTLSKIKMAIDAGDPPPRGWDPSRPWEVVWRTVLNDQDYWREQVHLPAMVWMAKGSKGVAMAPDEEIIKEREKGRRDNAESSLGGDPGEVKKLSNRAKKEARKRKWAAEREELKNLREGKGKSGKGGGGKHGGAGRGGSGNPGEEECYAWNNTVQRKGAEVAPLHGVQVTGPPFERVPAEEGIWWLKMMGWCGWAPLRGKVHAGEEEASSSNPPPQVPKAEKGTKRKRFTGGDPPDKKEAPKDHIFVEGEYLDFEGYCGARPFVFLHHFSGQEDRLGQAVKEESEKIGLKVTTYSADIEKGHDLTADKPHQSHHFGAYMADIDGYHFGFPCNTFTKLRWRPLAGHPGPLRSKSEPYGFKTLSPEKKAECDKGTILMARSVDMVKAMERGHQDMMVKGFATLENPPPSDHPQHISAWHMPELVQLVDGLPQWESAHFHTCAYQSDREVGTRHFKPQLVASQEVALVETHPTNP